MHSPDELTIDLKKELQAKSDKLIRYLKVAIGHTVSKGQVVAAKSSWFRKVIVKAPEDGEIVGLMESGTLIIRPSGRKPTARTKPKDTSGPLVYFDRKIGLNDLGPEQAGSIIACRQPISEEVIYKADAIGVKGLVVDGDSDPKRWVDRLTDLVYLALPSGADGESYLSKWQGKMVAIKHGKLIKEDA